MVDKFVSNIKEDDEFSFFKDFDYNFELSEKEEYSKFLEQFNMGDLKLLNDLRKTELVKLTDGMKVPRRIMRIRRRRGN